MCRRRPPRSPLPCGAQQVEHYAFIDGMEPLLARLSGAGYALHAMSNYPVWWRNIEDKLRLSRYLEWTFVSCEGPMRVSGGHAVAAWAGAPVARTGVCVGAKGVQTNVCVSTPRMRPVVCATWTCCMGVLP